MRVFILLSGTQPDCSADSFERSLEHRELPTVIYPGRCPKITDIYELTVKEQHFSTAAMCSIFKRFPICYRW